MLCKLIHLKVLGELSLRIVIKIKCEIRLKQREILTQVSGGSGVPCGTSNAEIAAVEGFRAGLSSTSLAGLVALELLVVCVWR